MYADTERVESSLFVNLSVFDKSTSNVLTL